MKSSYPKFVKSILLLALLIIISIVLSESRTTPQLETRRKGASEQKNQDLKELSQKSSPSGKKLAYFQAKYTKDEVSQIGDKDYMAVMVEDGANKTAVFKGDFHLSSLEWLTDDELVVYRSCGTECITANLVDTKTAEKQAINLGVGYSWSPDKQYVLAHHYAINYGISIASRENHFEKSLLQIRRNHTPAGSALANQTRTTWAPDSTKLALIIRKEGEERLELLVFDLLDDFRVLVQKDLAETAISSLAWSNTNTVVLTENGINRRISF